MADGRGYSRKRRFLIWVLAVFWVSAFLYGCGYSKEEKMRLKAIKEQGRENAVSYVKAKYGFTPEISGIEVCKERNDADPLPWANGYVLAFLKYGDEEFQVHISGEEPTLEGRDDYQYGIIMDEARAYFNDLVGYELYDLYLEYGENPNLGPEFPECHEDYFLRDVYVSGSFEQMLCHSSMNIRMDDCENQDFTKWKEEKPEVVDFFQKCAREYGTKAILISYRSPEDYQKGYEHNYARGGILDFDIEEDGLYIRSYAAFEESEETINRFELQEFDGLMFSCFDKSEGADLVVSKDEAEWLDLGETKGEPFSGVYSVEKQGRNPVVIYIPTEVYGRGAKVFIQHFYDDRWRQYEDYNHLTRDKRYIVVSLLGPSAGRVDFRVFR